MELQKAEIRCNKLILQFEADKKSADRDMVVLRCRKQGGYQESEREYLIENVECVGKKYVANMEIDLSEMDFDGLYWDILFKNVKKDKAEYLILDETEGTEVQKKAKKTEYWISDNEAVRLYPAKDGKVFLKKILEGVVYQKFGSGAPSVSEYVIGPNVKPHGVRYVNMNDVSEDKMVFSLIDGLDIVGADFCLVLIDDKDEKKQIITVENKSDEFVVDLNHISFEPEKNYRVYMAAKKGGFYYYFRLRARKSNDIIAEPSSVYYDSDRYKAVYHIGGMQALLYTGASNEGLNLIFGSREFCEQKKKGLPRIAAEKAEYFPFMFTMIIAVYNAEQYLGETIESILNQDIGFKKNIQIVLVDDGSTDDSLTVCNYYADRYQGNIVVKHKENGGVSTARNYGLNFAEGKYINFMDSDDILSENTCRAVWDFFEEKDNYEKTDVVSIPIYQFGAITGAHWQNYKFNKGTRIIDLNKEYGITCMNSAASFIKNKVAKAFRFDESLDHAEDLKYMLQIVPLKMHIGVVAECKYMYRRYPEGIASLVSSGKKKKNFYTNSLNVLVYDTLDKYMAELGYVPKFVQNTLMVDMQWKLKMREFVDGVLTEEEESEYLDKLAGVFKYIDDQVILTQKMIQLEYKYQAIKLKYGYVTKKQVYKDILYSVQNTIIGYASSSRDYIEFIDIKRDKLVMEGYTTVIDSTEEDVIDNYVSVGGTLYKCEKTNIELESKNVFDRLMTCVSYKIELPLDEDVIGKNIYLYTSVNGHMIARRNHMFSKFAPFSKVCDCQYTVKNNYIIKKVKTGFVVEEYSEQAVKDLEQEYIENLKLLREEKENAENYEAVEAIDKAIAVRKAYFEKKAELKKEIWLISDRPDVAGDNGEAFFRYVSSIKPKDVEYYFVIAEGTKDYEEMSKYGNIIPFGSEQLKLYTLFADKLISSQAEDYILNPFEELYDYIRDLLHYKFVFLQHGITKDDLSGWLNRYNKNISLFVTAAKAEYDSIVNGAYYYTDGQVQLTGFPRFDRLIAKKRPEKEIIFMPTWRKNLASGVDAKTGKRIYMKGFTDSDYYKFYQKLISDARIIEALKKKGYKGKFVIHPSNKENAGDFVGNDVISVCYEGVSYREEFIRNALLITDYSSVAFDFAYLRKPVIYTQSDREEFFAEHTYDEGYWDYKEDGFGPVCESYEETVAEIIKAVHDNCVIEEKYEERINQFYDAFDSKNSQRVYEAIRRLK
ncbi:MAG: CDP-glycerol glycerophosphotransferase family protein [Coprococcus sp.]|nr:CDP-glycerol glycerophosphotransferase family protein [Coprococcus sp.]